MNIHLIWNSRIVLTSAETFQFLLKSGKSKLKNILHGDRNAFVRAHELNALSNVARTDSRDKLVANFMSTSSPRTPLPFL